MSPKFILFNCHPGAGKDTVAGVLHNNYRYSENGVSVCTDIDKYANALTNIIQHLHGLSDFDIESLESNKNEPQEIFQGRSFRQEKIFLSETVLKPIYGQDIFGKAFTNKYKPKVPKPLQTLHFVTDSGFFSEIENLVDTFGPENCIVVRMTRKVNKTDMVDYTGQFYYFDDEGIKQKDSRVYWDYKALGINHCLEFENNSTPTQAAETILAFIEDVWGIEATGVLK